MKKDPKDWAPEYLDRKVQELSKELCKLKEIISDRHKQDQAERDRLAKIELEKGWLNYFSTLKPFEVKAEIRRVVWARSESDARSRSYLDAKSVMGVVGPTTVANIEVPEKDDRPTYAWSDRGGWFPMSGVLTHNRCPTSAEIVAKRKELEAKYGEETIV